jgi:hypothetical protein
MNRKTVGDAVTSWPSVLIIAAALAIGAARFAAPEILSAESSTEDLPPALPAGALLVVRDSRLLELEATGTVLRDYGGIGDYRLESPSPDRAAAALISRDGSTLAVFDRPSRQVRILYHDPAALLGYARWAADGGSLYVVRTPRGAGLGDAWAILRADLRTGKVHDISPRPNATYAQPNALPDGRLVFESQDRTTMEPMTIYVADAEGHGARLLEPARQPFKKCASIAVSPAGDQIAYSCGTSNLSEAWLEIFDLRTGNRREFHMPLTLPKWLTTGELVAVGAYLHGQCPTQVNWVRSDGHAHVIFDAPDGSVKIISTAEDKVLVLRSRCVRDEAVDPSRLYWVDERGRTFDLGPASQALWLGPLGP